jgi:signal transduction histidine kinase/ActR/RegA family two-component response regulator
MENAAVERNEESYDGRTAVAQPNAPTVKPENPGIRPVWQRYGFSVGVVLMAIWLRLLLMPMLETEYPFVTIFPAVVTAALWAGFGPGMLAVILSFGLAYYFGFASGVPFTFGTPTDLTATVINFIGATFVCYVAASMRTVKSDLRRQQGELKELVEQRTVELEKSNALLRQEVERRSEAESRMQAALVAKDDFIAALSHELRTPLNPVLLIASEGSANVALSSEVRQDFELIAKNIRLEARLIDDLLDITRITHGKMSLDVQIVQIDQVLTESIANVQDELKAKAIRLDKKFEAATHTVVGDPARLLQIFWNVLKNAAKFTPCDGMINVTTAVVAKQLEVTVSDTGIGMTPEELERVFSPFEQGEHSADGTGNFSGLGLGLSIAHMLIERHSGTIKASSLGRGQGATFTITLPLAERALLQAEALATTKVEPPPVSLPVERSRILLVEDDNSSRTALARLLTRRNYEVISTASVAEALAAAAGQTFEFVISDIGLPDQDGNVLMKELRQRYGLKGIALTGYGTQNDIASSEAAGFVAHLTKPVSISTLELAIADLRSAESKAAPVQGAS